MRKGHLKLLSGNEKGQLLDGVSVRARRQNWKILNYDFISPLQKEKDGVGWVIETSPTRSHARSMIYTKMRRKRK